MSDRYDLRTAAPGLLAWRCRDCHDPGPWLVVRAEGLDRDIARHEARHTPRSATTCATQVVAGPPHASRPTTKDRA